MGTIVGIPGPGAAEWAVGLLAWAVLALLVGELLRALTARWVPLWQRPDPIEQGLLDLYLGGAVLYLAASVPWNAFVAPLVYALPLVGAAGVGVLALRAARRPGGAREIRDRLAPLLHPVRAVVLLSALALFLVELWVAAPVATGNTYDSSLLTLYTSLLLNHHSTALSFAPYASTGLLYPQGTTVWLGGAQLWFGLPPARTALLVTPLFFGLAPLAGFTFGRRWFSSDRAGLATALVLAWVGVGTRGIVFGSNDFVLAFPLVLLLAGQAVIWTRDSLPRIGDVLGFGILLGYSAALNPVGAEWLLLALPVIALLVRPRFGGRPIPWFGRWAAAVGTALVGVLPSLYVLAIGHSSSGFVPGATGPAAGSSPGITASQFIGCIDPFLFGDSDTGLSTVAALRLELAILIAVGIAVLLLVGRDSALGRYCEPFRPFVVGAVVAQVALLAVCWLASTGFGPAVDVASITSSNELSISLFSVYGFIGAIPLALALERFAGWIRRVEAPMRRPESPRPSASWSGKTRRVLASRAVIPFVVALVIVVPGVVLTPTVLPPTLSQQYHDFGNVTADDFDLLSYAGTHLPSGARVLVAPGSAGQFLPGYCANLVLLYPMVPDWSTVNASYERLVRDLPNATFTSQDARAIALLSVEFIVVTGNNTMLWPAFSPRPFLSDQATYNVTFHEGDAYLFRVIA